MVTTLLLKVSNLQKELDLTKKTLQATRLENARLKAEPQESCEQFQHALVVNSRATSEGNHCTPVEQAGDPMFSPSTATVLFYGLERGIQAYNGLQVGVQQQRFYGYDLSRHWYETGQAATHGAQVQGAHSVPSYE
jgi:hypothetical protein